MHDAAEKIRQYESDQMIKRHVENVVSITRTRGLLFTKIVDEELA